MDLTRYVDNLRRELMVSVKEGDKEGLELAERLVTQLLSSLQLTLLEVLSAGADEITREMAPGSVEIRLQGLEPRFVVTLPPGGQLHNNEDAHEDHEGAIVAPLPPMMTSSAGGKSGATARISFRPSAYLKTRIEQAANREQLSMNAWLVRAVSATLESTARDPRPDRHAPAMRPAASRVTPGGRHTG